MYERPKSPEDERASDAEPSEVVPLWKTTLPVAEELDTVAVRLIAVPNTAEMADAANVVVVDVGAAAVTVTITAEDVLLVYVEFPL